MPPMPLVYHRPLALAGSGILDAMPLFMSRPVSGRYLSFAEREMTPLSQVQESTQFPGRFSSILRLRQQRLCVFTDLDPSFSKLFCPVWCPSGSNHFGTSFGTKSRALVRYTVAPHGTLLDNSRHLETRMETGLGGIRGGKRKLPPEVSDGSFSWGTRIRTSIGGTRIRSPAIGRYPSRGEKSYGNRPKMSSPQSNALRQSVQQAQNRAQDFAPQQTLAPEVPHQGSIRTAAGSTTGRIPPDNQNPPQD